MRFPSIIRETGGWRTTAGGGGSIRSEPSTESRTVPRLLGEPHPWQTPARRASIAGGGVISVSIVTIDGIRGGLIRRFPIRLVCAIADRLVRGDSGSAAGGGSGASSGASMASLGSPSV